MENVAALATSPRNGQAGKMSDDWIRANCDGQYLMQQYNSAGTTATYMPLYCRFTATESYRDDTKTVKVCVLHSHCPHHYCWMLHWSLSMRMRARFGAAYGLLVEGQGTSHS